MTFAERLAEVTASRNSLLCCGLDPDGVASAADAERVCVETLDAVLDQVAAVKPNVAFFEQFGSAGWAALERIRDRVPSDVIYLIDAKRGDIGSTARAYARGLYDILGADAVTVNPLMGADSVEPWLRPGKGVFLLTRTSNSGARDLLLRRLEDGRTLYETIIDAAAGWGPAAEIGFVVGATDPGAVAAVRSRAPAAPLLVPGVGAQGGDLEATIRAGLDSSGAGLLIPVSRGIMQAPEGPAAAAGELNRRIAAARTTASA